RVSDVENNHRLPHGDLLRLQRLNTPTIYNGWEQITRAERTRGLFNREQTVDYMPDLGAMVGYAVTVIIEPSNSYYPENHPEAWEQYRSYLAGIHGPKIVVVQDRDLPAIGSFWGEVNATTHQALGCVGTITDGVVRDLDEMQSIGFKALAARTCVGHAYSWPVKWGCEVEVFGCPVKPGQLIHADKHGFLVIPEEDEKQLLEAAEFMDKAECDTKIKVPREAVGKNDQEILEDLNRADREFTEMVNKKYE
ncbi:MAG: RraA family protein, partial [Bacillota bacterium]